MAGDPHDLIADIALHGLGRLPPRVRTEAPVALSYVRDITLDDLARLMTEPREPAPVTQLQSLRATHHSLARCLATGMSHADAAATTGHSISRVAFLTSSDRGFIELVEHYKGIKQEEFVDAQKRLASLGLAAQEILQERLEESPEAFTNKELREVAEFAFDRSIAPSKGAGAGRGQANPVNIAVSFVSPRAPEVEARAESPMIDLKPERETP